MTRQKSILILFCQLSLVVVVIFSSCQTSKIKTQRCMGEVIVPQKYKEVTKRVLQHQAIQYDENGKQLPAKYDRVTERIMLPGAGPRQMEVLCEKELSVKTRKIVQKALEKKGYSFNSNGTATQAELLEQLTSYQQENELLSGYFTIQSLRHLGVDFKWD